MLKKIKIALHWQILIAIIAAIIFGINFPDKHKFTDSNFEQFAQKAEKYKIPSDIVNNLEKFVNLYTFDRNEIISVAQKGTAYNLNEQQKNFILKSSAYNKEVSFVSWLGIIFMRALKMIIVPLVLTSIISGIAGIGSAGSLGRLGLKTIIYYLSTSTIAILTGLALVNIIKPGVDSNLQTNQELKELEVLNNSFSDTLINIVPDNIFKAFIEQDMLAIIFFSVLFGFFITKLDFKSKNFLTDFFTSANEVIMKITMFIVKFTPLGVFGIIAKTVAEQSDNINNLAQSLGLYSLTVIAGLFIHSAIILPLLNKTFGKSSPYKTFKAVRNALFTAFSTSSSGATLSLTMESVEHNAGASKKVSSFVLPLGATINMDGTALYECVAAIFIAQVYGYDLTTAEQVIIVITALLASIGAAAVPMAGLVMLSIVLTAVDLPLAGIALVLPVDRILDMFRTTVNVWSDVNGTVIIAKSEGEELKV